MAERDQDGMTLLEVIVALVILSLGLAALFNTVSLGTRTASLADQQREAAAAAQSLLAELGRSRPISDGVSTGAFPTGQSWQLEIAPLEPASTGDAPSAGNTPAASALPAQNASTGLLQGHRARLIVSWPDAAQTRSVAFDTILLTVSP